MALISRSQAAALEAAVGAPVLRNGPCGAVAAAAAAAVVAAAVVAVAAAAPKKPVFSRVLLASTFPPQSPSLAVVEMRQLIHPPAGAVL